MLKCECGGEVVPIFNGDYCQCERCQDGYRTNLHPEKRTTKCRGCGKEIIFMPTKGGKFMPVDLETYDGTTLFDSKRHVSHFATCPKGKEFRKDNR